MPNAQAALNIPKKEIVTAYARVSTSKMEQAESQERQEEYYKDYIKRRNDWVYRDLYADPGLSATRAEKRPGFMRMIEDARAGLFNRILVKGLSRFARNTVDALTYIRLLKEWGVAVVFESENIDTMTPGGEVLITILAGLAEQESRNIAKNTAWGFNKKFAAGGICMPTANFLGYAKDKDGVIIIDETEAPIVQRIFREYIGGYTLTQIAQRLTNDGVKTPSGKSRWHNTGVLAIIQNHKYCGDAIMGKTYRLDVTSHKRIKNDGVARDLFHIKDCCPPIVTKEEFALANAEYDNRISLRSTTKSGKGKYSTKYTFSGMLECGCCGTKWRRWGLGYGKGEAKKRIWICTNKQTVKECNESYVKEFTIRQAFLRVLNSLITAEEGFSDTLTKNIRAEINDDSVLTIEALDEQITACQADALALSRDNRGGKISDSEYEILIAENEKTQLELIKKKTQSVLNNGGVKVLEKRIDDIMAIIKTGTNLQEFSPEVFRQLVSKVVITYEKATFHFKCGLKLKEKLDHKERPPKGQPWDEGIITDHEKEDPSEPYYSDDTGAADEELSSSAKSEGEIVATNDADTTPTSHDSDLDDFLEKLKQKYNADNN